MAGRLAPSVESDSKGGVGQEVELCQWSTMVFRER